MATLKEIMKKQRNLQQSTVDSYILHLSSLHDKEPFNDLDWLTNIDHIKDIIKGKSCGSAKTYLAVVLTTLGTNPLKFKALHKKYTTLFNEKKKLCDATDTSKKTAKQEKSWISWDKVLERQADLKDKIKNIPSVSVISDMNYKKLLNYMVLSLYTLLPPGRNIDYTLMDVLKNGYTATMPKDVNYLDVKNHKMIFNIFKTVKDEGQQIVSYADRPELIQAIETYLSHHPLNTGKESQFPFLVRHNGTPIRLSSQMTMLMNAIFKKNIGPGMLRHIYLSDKYNIGDMEKDAKLMRHSLGQQKEYMKE